MIHFQPKYIQGNTTAREIQAKLDLCKRAFYSLVGGSLFKSTLSPLALSKVYQSIVIPKLMYGAEVRKYSDAEIDTYEKFHRKMGKDIQSLSGSTPNPVAFATLGWKEIACKIDIIRLQFIQRILSLDAQCIYRLLFLRRFYYVVYAGVDSCTGPIAQIVRTCIKYNFLQTVLGLIEEGGSISKEVWKKSVLRIVCDLEHANWRFSLTLYPKLSIFRTVIQKCEPVCWWQLAKAQPYLKRTCITVVNLFCGNSVLAQYKNTTAPRVERLCKLCDLREVEDTLHFIHQCPHFSVQRYALLSNIRSGLSEEGRIQWDDLGVTLRAYIILGMDFPLPTDDLLHIRIQSCISLHSMYNDRLHCPV